MTTVLQHRFRAVIFDLDGTLIDSAPDIADAINMVMAEFGRQALTERTVRDMVGNGWAGLLERVMILTGGMPEGAASAIEDRFRHFYLPRSTRLSSLYPGVAGTIDALHRNGTAIGVCTNKRQAGADHVIATFGLGQAIGAVVGGDTGVMKPDPAHLAVVLDRLGVGATEAVMVGDSHADVAAAHGAGMPCVVVSYGYAGGAPASLGADRMIDCMEDLIPALASL
ncbi:MAG: phosphoglycolate phosphatase [Alphaproteobacteria bacterium]|nr:phosphoglycolate phosphatase [Alphaproteobacteria bacterium]